MARGERLLFQDHPMALHHRVHGAYEAFESLKRATRACDTQRNAANGRFEGQKAKRHEVPDRLAR